MTLLSSVLVGTHLALTAESGFVGLIVATILIAAFFIWDAHRKHESVSADIKDFRDAAASVIGRLDQRVKDLEHHVIAHTGPIGATPPAEAPVELPAPPAVVLPPAAPTQG